MLVRILHTLSLIFVTFLLFQQPADAITKRNPMFEQLKVVQERVESNSWQEAKEAGEQLLQIFHEQKWKIEYLGNRFTNTQLLRYIAQLEVAIAHKDQLEAELLLENINAILERVVLF